MKTTLIFLLLSFITIGQTYPIIQEFDPPLAWNTTNGAGIQNYGVSENYLTTNIGLTPYPNSSTITMTSPIVNYSNCATNLSISFPLSGTIENGFDFMRFQYSTDGGGSWNTLGIYTGIQNTNYTYIVPSTANRFRFRLVTDNTINTYGPWWNIGVYYYDIARFTINCSAVLPIDLAYFIGSNSNNSNTLEWKTESEEDNNYFEIYRSDDANNWQLIAHIKGNGNTSTGYTYYLTDSKYNNIINYYKLVQIDNNGTINEYNTISIDNRVDQEEIISTTNILGQKVDENYKGLILVTYTNGKVKKIYK